MMEHRRPEAPEAKSIPGADQAQGGPAGRVAHLSAGSNLGDRMANLRRALAGLSAEGLRIRRVSSVYHTEPVGYLDQPWFFNIAVELETSLSPRSLLQACRTVEEAGGRTRTLPGGPRAIDLDILLYGDAVVDEPDLQIPHPRMAGRRFVLQPLAEIAPQAVHPVLKVSVRALLEACPDRSSVIPYPAQGML